VISGTTRLLGVIGDPVAHSRSPRMQNAALQQMGLDWTYVPLHVPADQLEHALRGLNALGFVGANVTVPHKEAVAQLVDELRPVAKASGSVNTITVVIRARSPCSGPAGRRGRQRQLWRRMAVSCRSTRAGRPLPRRWRGTWPARVTWSR
jgi:hypothetical protein